MPFKKIKEHLNFYQLDPLSYIGSEEVPQHQKLLRPGLGYSSIEEEYCDLMKRIIVSPQQLYTEKPRFVFSYLKDHPESLSFVEKLLESQKNIKSWLESETFLEDCLMAFVGIKLVIYQDYSNINVQFIKS